MYFIGDDARNTNIQGDENYCENNNYYNKLFE